MRAVWQCGGVAAWVAWVSGISELVLPTFILKNEGQLDVEREREGVGGGSPDVWRVRGIEATLRRLLLHRAMLNAHQPGAMRATTRTWAWAAGQRGPAIPGHDLAERDRV